MGQVTKEFDTYYTKGTDCWLWTGHINSDGYGEYYYGGSRMKAHRYSYQLYKGPIPKGLVIMHSCDVTSCVNPDHLSAGTHADNMADMWAKGRGWNGDKNGQRKYPGAAANENNGNAKLTDDQVRMMRMLHEELEVSQRKLAVIFGISRGQVNNIVNYKQRILSEPVKGVDELRDANVKVSVNQFDGVSIKTSK